MTPAAYMTQALHKTLDTTAKHASYFVGHCEARKIIRRSFSTARSMVLVLFGLTECSRQSGCLVLDSFKTWQVEREVASTRPMTTRFSWSLRRTKNLATLQVKHCLMKTRWSSSWFKRAMKMHWWFPSWKARQTRSTGGSTTVFCLHRGSKEAIGEISLQNQGILSNVKGQGQTKSRTLSQVRRSPQFQIHCFLSFWTCKN